MGWNSLQKVGGTLFSQELEGAFVYFVHSYYAAIGENTSAIANYINPFSAAIERDNFYATQFHPEKSGPVGEKILQNFLAL
jgi:glutamine amidotransferase